MRRACARLPCRPSAHREPGAAHPRVDAGGAGDLPPAGVRGNPRRCPRPHPTRSGPARAAATPGPTAGATPAARPGPLHPTRRATAAARDPSATPLAGPGTRRDEGPRGSDAGVVERAAEGILAMPGRVVSGGQTGADQDGRRTSPSEASGTRSAAPATARRTRRGTGAAARIPTAPVGGVRLPCGAGESGEKDAARDARPGTRRLIPDGRVARCTCPLPCRRGRPRAHPSVRSGAAARSA